MKENTFNALENIKVMGEDNWFVQSYDSANEVVDQFEGGDQTVLNHNLVIEKWPAKLLVLEVSPSDRDEWLSYYPDGVMLLGHDGQGYGWTTEVFVWEL